MAKDILKDVGGLCIAARNTDYFHSQNMGADRILQFDGYNAACGSLLAVD